MVELLRLDFDERTWRMFWETAVIGRPPLDVADEIGVSKWAIYKARARILQRLQQAMEGLE
jgi:RNA polymerase sigma-70 factor (ECF subfamily)